MTTTTFTATGVAASAVGLYVVPEDGSARGQVRQVKSFSGTTATVDKAWAAVTANTSIRAFKPADVPVVATGSGSTTTIVASGHASITNEPDDYWNDAGYFLLFVGGQNAGSAVKVTDFTSSTGTFTFTPAVTSTVTGEFALLVKLLRPEAPVEATITPKVISRRIVGFSDADAPVNITSDGTISFTLPQRPIATAGSNAVQPTPPLELGEILRDVFTQTRDTGGTSASMAGTTITSANHTMTAGGFVMVHTGEAGQILSTNATDIVVGTGHITAASVGTGHAYASAWYKRKESDFRTSSHHLWRGRLHRQAYHGCLPTVDMVLERDNMLRFNLAYTAGDCIEYPQVAPVTLSATNPITLIDQTVPVDGKASRLLIDGTNVLCSQLTVNAGFTPQYRNSLQGMNQHDGSWMDVGVVTGTMTLLADNDDISSFRAICDKMRLGAFFHLFLQKGTAPTETFCMGMPAAHLTGGPFSYDAGQGVFSCTFEAVHPAAARGTSYAAALPAWSFGWL
jgi:hypothetical protein